jgi:hypothetical protein
MNDGTPPEINDLLGAYALDAVDPDERDLVERHLVDDPAARAEVDEMRETAAVLASLPVDDEGAPAGLWNRIAGAIGVGDEDAPSTVVPLARPKRTASIPARFAAPIAAVAALVIAILAVQVATRDPNRAGDLAAAYKNALANGATVVQLARSGTSPVAAEIALKNDGSGYLRNNDLAPLPEGSTYQLWALVGSGAEQRAISAGVLGADPSAAAFHVAGRPDAFAITIEDAPGVVQSAHQPTAVGKVPI